MNTQPSTASCSPGPAPRPSWRPTCSPAPDPGSTARQSRQGHAALQYHGRPARRLRALRHPCAARHARSLQGIDARPLRENLARFLREVIPTAEEGGIRMAIHPDDPPRSIMGLPRIVSNADDIAFITSAVSSAANGLTFVHRLARRRCTERCSGNRAPVRANASTSCICATSPRSRTAPSWKPIIWAGIRIWSRSSRRCCRSRAADSTPAIPPGGSRSGRIDRHELLDDAGKKSFPGYSTIGRLKGLAEICGVMTAVAQLARAARVTDAAPAGSKLSFVRKTVLSSASRRRLSKARALVSLECWS